MMPRSLAEVNKITSSHSRIASCTIKSWPLWNGFIPPGMRPIVFIFTPINYSTVVYNLIGLNNYLYNRAETREN